MAGAMWTAITTGPKDPDAIEDHEGIASYAGMCWLVNHYYI